MILFTCPIVINRDNKGFEFFQSKFHFGTITMLTARNYVSDDISFGTVYSIYPRVDVFSSQFSLSIDLLKRFRTAINTVLGVYKFDFFFSKIKFYFSSVCTFLKKFEVDIKGRLSIPQSIRRFSYMIFSIITMPRKTPQKVRSINRDFVTTITPTEPFSFVVLWNVFRKHYKTSKSLSNKTLNFSHVYIISKEYLPCKD